MHLPGIGWLAGLNANSPGRSVRATVRGATIAALAGLVLLGGCTTTVVARYPPSADQVLAMKALRLPGVGLEPFAPPEQSPGPCRQGLRSGPGGGEYAAYISRAFAEVVKFGDAYANVSPRVMLGGQVTRIGFSTVESGFSRGYWDIELELVSSNGRRMTVTERYEFPSSFVGVYACTAAAAAFPAAVERLIGTALRSERFSGLFE